MQQILSFLTSFLQADVEAAVSRKVQGFGLKAVAILCLLTAYIAGLAALGLYLAQEFMSPWAAAGSIALGFVVLGGGVWTFSVMQEQAAKREAEAIANAREEARMEILSAFGVNGSSNGPGGKQVTLLLTLAGFLISAFLKKNQDNDDDEEDD